MINAGGGFPDVVVTGIVATTPLAADAEKTWQGLLDGQSGIHVFDDPMVDEWDLPVRIGGLLQDDIDSQMTRVELRRLTSLQRLAVVLSRRLWEQAGAEDVDTRDLLVSVGLALGTTDEMVRQYWVFLEKGLRAVSPLAVQMYMPNAPAAAIGLDREAKAGIISPLESDASGASAIANAWQSLVLGDADIAICGGVDTEISPVPIAAYGNLDLWSERNDDPAGACRPFAADRDGMVFGQGGAMLLLETREHAEARGASILGRLVGVGMTADGADAVLPDPSGEAAARAVSRALEVAGWQPADVDLVIAHGIGTKENDLAEARALHQALGDHRPAVYSAKGAVGHTFGAAGAIDAVLAVQALRDGVVPATRNVTQVDPDIDLDVVTGEPRRGEYRHVVVDNFGFGGFNVALAFSAAD